MTVTMDNEVGRDKVRNLKPWVWVLEIFSILLSLPNSATFSIIHSAMLQKLPK